MAAGQTTEKHQNHNPTTFCFSDLGTLESILPSRIKFFKSPQSGGRCLPASLKLVSGMGAAFSIQTMT